MATPYTRYILDYATPCRKYIFEETTALGYTKYDATLKAYNLRMCFEFKSWFLFMTYLFVVYGKGFSTII